MSYFLELLLDGLIYGWDLVTVHVAPEGRYTVQVFPTLGVIKIGPLRLDDDGNIRVRFPFLLLGERMPKVFLIFFY